MALRLPSGYLPFRELTLCSNVLVNVPVPLSVGDQPALLIGQGYSTGNPVPRVWLAAPAAPDSKEWAYVVEASRPLRPLITVTAPTRISLEVSVGAPPSTVVLRVTMTAPHSALVDALDLRPLGLIAYGNERELHIGGMMMERNRFADLQVAFAIGVEEHRAGNRP